MDIEEIKANKPEGSEYFDPAIGGGFYYRIYGGAVQHYSKFHKEWIDSLRYTKGNLPEKLIDLRDNSNNWTPENNTLHFGELTREQKLALMTAWIDGGLAYLLNSDSDFVMSDHPSWLCEYVYQVRKSPRAAFIEQCKDLSAAEIYDAIVSGELTVEKGE